MSDSVLTSISGSRPAPPAGQEVELGSPVNPAAIAAAVPPALLERVAAEPQRGFPAIANAKYEMGAGGFYGKPYEPNGVIKNDIEHSLNRVRGALESPSQLPLDRTA